MTEYTKSENLRKHMLAVEAAMRFYAKKFGEDEEKWAVVGLLHDFDYEQHPSLEEHPFVGVKILQEKGVEEEITRAILAHAEHTGVVPETLLEKSIFAVDELTGFIVAVALVRPTKSLMDVTVKSVKKKMKDKAFARNVRREDIRKGAELLGLSLEEHIGNVIEAMQGIAGELGLP
ncbi:MAG: HDIG domain-containing protein [Calditrichaeota bacterium]|nr:MAG: HDIG domain-containing protein [Calditrichota bacterium]